MKIKTAMSLALLCGVLSGCANQPYSHPNLEADSNYPYQQLNTFCITPKQFVGSATDVEQIITDGLNNALTAKGYQQASCEKSDFEVEFYARRTEEKQMATRQIPSAAGTFTEYRMEDVLTGALAIHLKDQKDTTFWKNLISKESRTAPSEEGQTKRIHKAIDILLEPFPGKTAAY